MSDYGFRISQNNYDVKTCADKDCIVTSKYPNLKGILVGSASLYNNGNQITTLTIPHNLGYIPFIKALFSFDNSTWYQFPHNISGIDYPYLIYTRLYTNCTSNNAYITFDKYDPNSPNPDTVYIKYFIYIDKGKL